MKLFGKSDKIIQRILIVEDEPLTAFDNENILGDAGYEIVATIEWMREYNRTRGQKPPVEIAGFDVTDERGAADVVTVYLNRVDPVAASTAIATYSDCLVSNALGDCGARMKAIGADLSAREAELVGRSSQREFDAASQGASIAAVSVTAPPLPTYFAWRDQNMAANVSQLKDRRSSNGRVILWGHQEHVGKTINLQSVKPMGGWLDEHYGADYFVIGSSAGSGMFHIISPASALLTSAFSPASADDYESFFRSGPMPAMLIPLRGGLPDWLAATHRLRGGSAGGYYDKSEDLKRKLDAIVYVDQTTPSLNFW